jgi:phosphoribosylanthranilate isomerase
VTIRIKICGIVHPDDAELAAEAGADLIGLNFVPDSPRRLELDVAARIADRVAGRVERVGVFRNADQDEIDRVLRRVDLDRLQFHGEETEEEVEAVDLPVIKAIRGADLEAAEQYPGTIVLLDHPDGGGGAGREWKWSDAAVLVESGHDVILAGGLSPENVARALSELGDLPWGVDVASGVEGPDRRKDERKLRAFVDAVRAVEAAAAEQTAAAGDAAE